MNFNKTMPECTAEDGSRTPAEKAQNRQQIPLDCNNFTAYLSETTP